MPPDALHAQVLQTPDDRQLLTVWSDALIAAGDPWGELVALSLADRDPARQQRLIRAHRARVVGPALDRVLSARSTFRHGLLDTIELRRCNPALAEQVASTPALRTVTRLRRGQAALAPYRTIVASPLLTHLRDVQLHPSQIAGEAAVPLVGPIDTVLVDAAPDDLTRAQLAEAPRFAGLRHLEILGDATLGREVPALVRTFTTLPIETLRIGGYAEEVLPLFFETGLTALWCWSHGLVREGGVVLVQQGFAPPEMLLGLALRLQDRIERLDLWRDDYLDLHLEQLRTSLPELEVRVLG